MQTSCTFSQTAFSSIDSLCPALTQLREEHFPLTAQKQELFEISQDIYDALLEGTPKEQLLLLRHNVQSFFNALHAHSKKEDDILFPMVALYIGKETGPIAVMEYEHKCATEAITLFLQKTETISDNITQDEAAKLSEYITEAYTILTDHFIKEEHILFPMAEQLLSPEEKVELLNKIQSL